MPRYLMFITHREAYREHPIPQGLLDEMGEFVAENRKSGVLIDTGGLAPTSSSALVRLSRGKVSVTDGPFTETKEVIGGYAFVQVPSMRDAIELATRFMHIHRRHWPEFEGACEVRPVEVEPSPATAATGVSEAAGR